MFCLQIDHPFSPSEHPTPVSGLDGAQVRRWLEAVRPDTVQYTVKGAAGYVPYRTSYGNDLPALEHWDGTDLLGFYREITRDLGIRFFVGYSGLIDYRAADGRPDWMRARSDGTHYPNRALCPNSGYVDELMLPQLAEVISLYSPDGVWTDSENWTVSPCYCYTCESEFRMLHGRPLPLDRGDSFWPEWLQFQRESFERYVERVSRFLHDRNDSLVYAGSGGWSTHQPDPAPHAVDRLTRDLSPAYSLRQAGMEARFFDSRGLPWDLVTWTRCSARPWPQGRLPALPVYPKTANHLVQEGALILANGGGWTVWTTAHSDDALPDGEMETIAAAAEFARARLECLPPTRSAAYAAVLHSAATHRKAGNGLYDPGPSLDRMRGAHQVLQELHHPHDIVEEEALLRDLGRYHLVVLPEQTVLPPRLDDPLREWVRSGGRLLASGRVSPRVMEDIPTFALEDVLGVQWTGRREREGWFRHAGRPLLIPGTVYHVTPTGAHPFLPMLRSGHETRAEESGHAGVTRHPFGQGEAFYVAADIFAAYHRAQYPGLRALLGEILDVALPGAPLGTTPSPTVEVILRAGEDALVVHFVEHAPGKSLAQNSPFIEAVPRTPQFSLELALEARPASVRLEPGGTEPEWAWDDGLLKVEVPEFHIHTAVVTCR